MSAAPTTPMWEQLLNKAPQCFIVATARAFSRRADLFESSEFGAAEARGFLMEAIVERAESPSHLYDLINSKIVETLVFRRKWMRRYPTASAAAADRALDLMSDTLMMSDVDEWCHHTHYGSDEVLLLQFWDPADSPRSKPMLVFEHNMTTGATAYLINVKREALARDLMTKFATHGYMALAGAATQLMKFKPDLADVLTHAVQEREYASISPSGSAAGGFFGRGAY